MRGLQEQHKRLDLSDGVASAASAARLGDNFEYAIDRPVDLARQRSALLPIVGKDVGAARVSIYNERVQGKHPLLGLRLKNATALNLMQGPVTVFEGQSYAGDARLADLQPGEERLVSYAIDLGTEVTAVPSSESGRILSVKAVAGVVETRVRHRQAKTYTAKNRGDQARTLLIEHPVNTAFALVGAKPKETTAEVYRFEVALPTGETKKLEVAEEREDRVSYSVLTEGDDRLQWLVSRPQASEKVKAALKRAMELRAAKARAAAELAELRRQLAAIVEDQTRMRANLKELPTNSQIHARLVKKFDEQETQVEKLRAEMKKLEEREHAENVAFRDFVVNLSVE